jgi:7-cyano-7-deazaguanine synthase
VTIAGPVVVLMSGGIDSSACASLLLHQGYSVRGLFIDYGQAAAPGERNAVLAVADKLSISLSQYTFEGGKTFGRGEIIGRNAFLISAALLFGNARAGLISIGIHAGTTYYDCSEAFVASMSRIVEEYTGGELQLVAPFIDWSKKQVYDYYVSTGLDPQLTYSCENGSVHPCGRCASCVDRKALDAG